MALEGVVTDLADPIERDTKIEFLTREDRRSLELIRHDCAHVLARRCKRGSPAPAGIDPASPMQKGQAVGLPRTCGDRPVVPEVINLVIVAPPHLRG